MPIQERHKVTALRIISSMSPWVTPQIHPPTSTINTGIQSQRNNFRIPKLTDKEEVVKNGYFPSTTLKVPCLEQISIWREKSSPLESCSDR